MRTIQIFLLFCLIPFFCTAQNDFAPSDSPLRDLMAELEAQAEKILGNLQTQDDEVVVPREEEEIDSPQADAQEQPEPSPPQEEIEKKTSIESDPVDYQTEQECRTKEWTPPDRTNRDKWYYKYSVFAIATIVIFIAGMVIVSNHEGKKPSS